MTEQLTLTFDAGSDATSAAERVPEPAPDQRARDRIRTDTASTLFVEAGAGAGKTSALIGRILTLVHEGVPIGAIAAITFTEKAAAELRYRLRAELSSGDPSEGRRTAVESLDEAPIGTIHAFARRILYEFPVEAGLPPGFGVLDELESQLALDERWDDLLDELLDDADRPVAPGLPAADFVRLCAWGKFGDTRGLRRVIADFQANWDLVEERVDLEPPELVDLELGELLAAVDRVTESAVPAGDGQERPVAELRAGAATLRRAAGLGATLDVLDVLRAAAARSTRAGNRNNWRVAGAEALATLRTAAAEVRDAIDDRLRRTRRYREQVVGAVAGQFVLQGALERARAGTLEFHDLLVLARRLLSRDERVRRVLHDRYRRVLLDEFQDTDPIQLEIAERLTAPPDQPGRPPVPGRLFVVGDPKQSIYRFRRADIAVYLAAGEVLGAEREILSANFRSTDAVIDWVNAVFGEVITPTPDVQPSFEPLDACRPGPRAHGSVTVLGVDPHDGDDVSAQVLRERESADVAAVVAGALRDGWLVTGDDGALRPCRPGDVAVLLPARTSLPMLETALTGAGVPYRAENSSVVYVAPEIRHLMLALRAACDPTDELAVVAALRTELYGCSDVELFDWHAAGGRWSLFAAAPAGFERHPVAEGLGHLRSLADRIGRASPAELLDAVVDERRVLETALTGTDARDVWRRIRYVIDQARSWTDAGGRGLRRYLRWTAHQAAEGRASDTILPERDHDAVRIMTVHAAKGLEFPITVVAGLTTQVQRRRAVSVVWPEGTWCLAERDSEVFEAFKPLDEQMSDAERRRLLYVACTRAVDHLVVSLHRKPEATADGTSGATSSTVLAEAGAAGHGAVAFAAAAGAAGVLDRPIAEALELPWADPREWQAERQRTIQRASVATATSATRLVQSWTPAPDATVDPGLAKDAVDLDLPPWQRGRYGTAIGRAVHAVLQDADLVAGSDIDRMAAAQCAAEGIFGFEERVAGLARSALSAPIVARAAAGADHWRELFVVAELGEQIVEGYVDLLVRTADGLVIVDYKTDQWRGAADRQARLDRYRYQLCVYGAVLGELLGEPIVAGVLVHCRTDGPAEQVVVDDWPAGVDAVRAAVGRDRSAGMVSA
jgi:ATP-dependent helicase/nuclease subunit A